MILFGHAEGPAGMLARGSLLPCSCFDTVQRLSAARQLPTTLRQKRARSSGWQNLQARAASQFDHIA